MLLIALEHLRREAKHCREMAARVSLSADAEALIRLALRCEAKAAELEAQAPDLSPEGGRPGSSGTVGQQPQADRLSAPPAA